MSCTDYQQFLNILRGSTLLSQCQPCSTHIHSQTWVPPPCKLHTEQLHKKKTTVGKDSRKQQKVPHFLAKKPLNKFKRSRHKHRSRPATPTSGEYSKQAHGSGFTSPRSSSVAASSSGPGAAGTAPSSTPGSSKHNEHKQGNECAKMLHLLTHDSRLLVRYKEKNYLLKKKVHRLQKQLRGKDPGIDMDSVEDLIKSYQDVLQQYMKLDNDKKSLEKVSRRNRMATKEVQVPELTKPSHHEENQQNLLLDYRAPVVQVQAPLQQRPSLHHSQQSAVHNPSHSNLPRDFTAQHPDSTHAYVGTHLYSQWAINPKYDDTLSQSFISLVNKRDAQQQCDLINMDEILAKSKAALETMEQERLQEYSDKLREVETVFKKVLGKYKEQISSQKMASVEQEQRWQQELSERESELNEYKQKLLQSYRIKNQTNEKHCQDDGDDEVAGGSGSYEAGISGKSYNNKSSRQQVPASSAVLSVEHLQALLEHCRQTGGGSDANLQAVRQTIEDVLSKWLQRVQQQQQNVDAAADVTRLTAKNDSLTQENKALVLKLARQDTLVDDLRTQVQASEQQLNDLQAKYEQLRHKNEELSREAHQAAAKSEARQHQQQADLEELRAQLVREQAVLCVATNTNERLQNDLQDRDRLVADLTQQLEDKIKECCSLNTKVEELSANLKLSSDSLQRREREQDSLVHEHKLQLRELQLQLRTMTDTRDTEAMDYKKQIRELKLRLDQLRVRNETFQRQLAAITSTYNHMFANTDGSDSNA